MPTLPKTKVRSSLALHVGGGSSMGYKLAGFDVIGCNEIDHRMMDIYCKNHNPRFSFLEPIQTFKDRTDLPSELFNLDILDGSPPCSTFSVVGLREKAWGKMKKFKEGQAEQVLDTLFFDFIDLAKKLQPKVVVAENVKGILLGKAKDYVRRIYQGFDYAGYHVQHFLLDAQYMGVPQRRQRVFFVCLRKDLIDYVSVQHNLFEAMPHLNLSFNEPRITCEDARLELGDDITTKCYVEEYVRLQRGERKKYLQSELVKKTDVHPTLIAGYSDKASPMPAWERRWLSTSDICKVSSFPQDYDFGTQQPHYVCGMSVPPVMMAQVASRIYEQWLSKIK